MYNETRMENLLQKSNKGISHELSAVSIILLLKIHKENQSFSFYFYTNMCRSKWVIPSI